MELRVLNYFLMVAREENITRAAQLLHITQPTLSRQLIKLEEELGVELFKRGNHNIVLTDEGMLLKRRAQELIALADKTRREFQVDEENIAGEIAIGSGELRGFAYFSEMLAAFQKKYPKVYFDIHSANADSIKARIENGLIDVGVLAEPVDIKKYDFIRISKKEIWGILLHEDLPLAKKEFIEPKDLVSEKLFVTKRYLSQSEFSNWLGVDIEDLDIKARYNLMYNVAVMAQKKMGIVVGINLNCKYENLKFIPFKPKLETRSVLVWKKNQILSPTVETFISYAKKYITKTQE